MPPPIDLTEYTLAELEELLAAWGQPRFRARQLLKWLMKGAAGFEAMTDLSRAFREELAQKAAIRRLRLEEEREAPDGTRKFLLSLADGNFIESVLIPEEGHSTLCLSTQVGCALGCRFCLTARRGLVRNLTAGEMVNQVLAVKSRLDGGLPLTNLVFMGMGEPLANFAALVKALGMITAPWGLNFSHRRITVSTAGVAPLIPRLGAAVRANLTVSLNAPDDATRSLLMPINRRYPLKTLLQACREFPLPRGRRFTFAYVLLDGVNDSPAQARELARLMKGCRCKVNLIPVNADPRLPYAPPPLARVLEFQEVLRAHHYPVFVRESRGREIAAACGQLVGEKVSGEQ